MLELDDEVELLESAALLDEDDVLDDEDAMFCLDDDELELLLLLADVCDSCWELDDEDAALWLDIEFCELDEEAAAFSDDVLEVLLSAALLDGSAAEDEDELVACWWLATIEDTVGIVSVFSPQPLPEEVRFTMPAVMPIATKADTTATTMAIFWLFDFDARRAWAFSRASRA